MRKWIESRLSELGKTKAELARHLDLPFARVSEVIKGKRELKSVEILPIAQFLELDPTLVLQLLADPTSKLTLGKKPIAVAGKVGAGAKVPLYDAYSKVTGFTMWPVLQIFPIMLMWLQWKLKATAWFLFIRMEMCCSILVT